MMETVLLSILAASALCPVFSRVEREYHFVHDLKNMTEAQKYCRENHTDLATIDSMVEVKIVNDMALSNTVNSQVWIGLYDDVNSWRWSLADGSFYKDGEAEFRKWGPGEPNNINSAEHCIQMSDGGQWSDTHCVKENPASVCFDVTGLKETSFILIINSMTWTEAQSYCREHHTDLASVRNEAENQQIEALVPAGKKVWIGLFRNPWKWSDGTKPSFANWRPGEPDNSLNREACVAAEFSNFGKWFDMACDLKRAFICYRRVVTKQAMRVRLVKTDSALDLNDPAVMEDLLKQLKQRLKDNGVAEGIKLSWTEQSDGKVFHEEEKETK